VPRLSAGLIDQPSAIHRRSIGDPAPHPGQAVRQAQIETVLAAWRVWHGSFSAFCTHVRRDHRLEFGTMLITNILFEYGLRVPARRDRRSRDDEALRKSFEIIVHTGEDPSWRTRPSILDQLRGWCAAPAAKKKLSSRTHV
jgi:hypothetical protein